MDRSIWRLLLICVAWSAGVMLVWAFQAWALDPLVPAIFATAAFVLTRDDGYRQGGGGGGGGTVKYWRGRRVDDRGPRRWN